MTRDGVARHIGVDGREVYSTAYLTRGGDHPLRYHHNNGGLMIGGLVHWGISQNKWTSNSPHSGLIRRAFHSFLAGPCALIDEKADDRVNLYDYTDFGGHTEIISCNAASTCGATSRPPRSEAYNRARALTDADYGACITQRTLSTRTQSGTLTRGMFLPSHPHPCLTFLADIARPPINCATSNPHCRSFVGCERSFCGHERAGDTPSEDPSAVAARKKEQGLQGPRHPQYGWWR